MYLSTHLPLHLWRDRALLRVIYHVARSHCAELDVRARARLGVIHETPQALARAELKVRHHNPSRTSEWLGFSSGAAQRPTGSSEEAKLPSCGAAGRLLVSARRRAERWR